MGASELRDIYLKADNLIHGEYFARIVKASQEHNINTVLSLRMNYNEG